MRLAAIWIAWILLAATATACPFCTAVSPSLAQQREQADCVVLAEVLAVGKPTTFRIHRVVKGESLLADTTSLAAIVDAELREGTLVLLFGSGDQNTLRWHVVRANETVVGYFFAAPTLRTPELERLPFFAKYLEHADPTIAADAYSEFGIAPFDLVEKVHDRVPSAKLRTWLTDAAVPPDRKGLYGLMLGLARDAETRRENAALLKRQIIADASDFRAGFDGVLGGYLLLEGEPGLALIESHLFANSKAAVGDVRHAMTALRFYHEYGKRIPPARLAKALASVLARPEFAEAAITDLARWQAWEYCRQIASLYQQPEYHAGEIRRSIVGYLHACPTRCASDALAELRKSDPQGVTDAERALENLGRLPQ